MDNKKVIMLKVFRLQPRHSFLFFLAVASWFFTKGQTTTVEELKKDYDRFFQVVLVGDQTRSVYVTVPRRPYEDSNILNRFFNEFRGGVDYLKTNYSSLDLGKADEYATDSLAAAKFVVSSLRNDEVFNKFFLNYLSRFLRANRLPLKDYSIKPVVKLSLDSLMRVTSKFFYAYSLDRSQKKIVWKICVGGNEWFHSEKRGLTRDKISSELPLLEAFGFNIVISIPTEHPELQEIYRQNMNEVATELAGIEGKEKLEKSRTRMYERMYHAKELRDLVLTKYKEQKAFLPFELTGY